MDKVFSIFDWWDGPLEGLTEYKGEKCIFQRVFDEKADEWTTDEFWLTPFPDDTADIWHCMKSKIKDETGDAFYMFRTNHPSPVHAPDGYHKYRVKGVFHFEPDLSFSSDIMKSEKNTVEWITL